MRYIYLLPFKNDIPWQIWDYLTSNCTETVKPHLNKKGSLSFSFSPCMFPFWLYLPSAIFFRIASCALIFLQISRAHRTTTYDSEEKEVIKI